MWRLRMGRIYRVVFVASSHRCLELNALVFLSFGVPQSLGYGCDVLVIARGLVKVGTAFRMSTSNWILLFSGEASWTTSDHGVGVG